MYDDASRAGEGISGRAFRCQFLPDSIPSADQADHTHPTLTLHTPASWVGYARPGMPACRREGGQWAVGSGQRIFSRI
jgi:hypothetical protein